MAELVDVRPDGEQTIIVFREGGQLLELTISGQAGANLVAGLVQAIVDRAPSNEPGVEWLQWPQMARSSEMSFDIEAIDSELVGIALKLPGLLPVTLEIPMDSAHAVADAIHKAADESAGLKRGVKR